MALVRLQKFLSEAGVCSRRTGEDYIRQGLIAVNGVVVTQLGTKIDPEKDRVRFRGKPLTLDDELVYIALNKPRGYVTSCRHRGDRIVLELVDIPRRVYPVGRLDRESTGLLLLTNDGRLHHRLSHPSFDHEKEYDVTVAGPISDQAIKRMEAGMPILGTMTRPARIQRISDRRFRIVLREGRNRQIRRMVEAVANRVTLLKRVRIAGIRLGGLKEGTWRYLSDKEKKALRKLLQDKADPGFHRKRGDPDQRIAEHPIALLDEKLDP